MDVLPSCPAPAPIVTSSAQKPPARRIPAGQTYAYSSLPSETSDASTTPSIRLLRILSGAEEPISCSLEVVNLDDPPLYDCLSYTWGDPLYHGLSAPQDIRETDDKRKFPISCDGLVICVTENLLEALLHLTRTGLSSTAGQYQYQRQALIWIDAICIDQENVPERNAQVTLMNAIYKSAQTIIVWLGISDVHTERALDVMTRLSSISPERCRAELPSNLEDRELYRLLGIRYIEPQAWLDYAAFLRRTWFSRMWVIQETAVARIIVVLCGSHVLSWSEITAGALILRETQLGNLLVSNMERASNLAVSSPRYVANTLTNPFIFDNVRRKRTSMTLEKLLGYSRYFDAGNQRDKFFAVLGMWKESLVDKELPENTKPNYDLSVEEVYAIASWAMIHETVDLNLLSQVEDSSFRSLSDLPSWVPDYTIPSQPHPRPLIDNHRAAAGEERWKASAGLNFSVPVQTDLLILPVTGICIDTITSIAATENEITELHKLQTVLKILAHLLEAPYPAGGTTLEAFWRTLIKDTFRGRPAGAEARDAFPKLITLIVWEIEEELRIIYDDIDPKLGPLDPSNLQATNMKSIHAETKALISFLSTHHKAYPVIPTWDGIQRLIAIVQANRENTETESPEEKALDRDFEAIEESFRIAYTGRRLFATESGYLGIAAQSLQKGDVVWILAGMVVPIVLRELKNGNWKLVGEAYVHGIMNGEGVSGKDENAIKHIRLE